MQKKILLVIFPTFSEFEVTVAMAILRGKYEVVTIAPNQEMQMGESGLQLQPHLTFEQVEPEAYEAIIIPGGDMIHLNNEDKLFELVAAFNQRQQLIGAICSGPFVLGKAGILEGHPYTVTLHKDQRDFLGCFPEAGYCYDKVVQSKHQLLKGMVTLSSDYL